MKKLTLALTTAVFFGLLAGCTSPEEKAAGYIANADTLLAENDLDKAALEYRNALQINQNLPDAWYGLARIHERQGQWKQAFGALSQIRDTNPDHVDGRIMMAQILLASNQIDQALEDANHVMELAPEDVRAHSLMAAVQFRLGNMEAAQESVARALAIDPDHSEAILVKARMLISDKAYAEAIETLDAGLRIQPDNTSLYLMKIQAYSELGDETAIEGVFKTLVERFPDNGAYKNALIRHYIQLDEIDKAEAMLEQLVEQNPDNLEMKERLVGFKNQYRSDDEAIAQARDFIEQNPDEYRFRFTLGELYQANQKTDEAMAVYQGIIDDDGVQPNGLEARNQLALIHLRAYRQDEAEKLVSEVLENDKSNANALILRSGFKIADRQFDEAIIDLRTVLRDNPDSIKALGLIGQAYASLGSVELAIESYSKAFELSPRTAAIANEFANILIRRNDPTRADQVLTQSISAGNQSVRSIKLLTQVKLMLGEWDVAEKLAQQLKTVEGEEATSEQVLGIVYQGRDQSDASIDAFKRAHELAPEAAEPVVALVRTYVQNDNVGEARQFLENILSENENNVTANLLLGQLSMRVGDMPGAIAYFERVAGINPNLEVSYRSLASIYTREKKLDDAERVLMEGLEQIPASSTLGIGLATVYEMRRKHDQAIGVYEELLEQNPDLIVAKNNLASLLSDRRDDQASYDRARELAAEFRSSDVHQFRDTYAWAAVKSGFNLEEAVAILNDIVSENADIGVYRFHLGEALRKTGNIENARLQLNKAIELEGADSAVAAQARESLQLLSE